MSGIFKDRTAVVTGAGGVLCSEIAMKLAAEGAKTVLVGRTAEKLQTVADKILAAGGTCMVRAADVTDESHGGAGRGSKGSLWAMQIPD